MPAFVATDIFDNEVNLAKYGDTYTLLVFLRYAGCPWCNLALHRLTIEYPRLKADKCQVVACIQSDKENILKNIYGRHNPKPQFPIIADQQMAIFDKFEVRPSIIGSLKMITNIPYWLQSVRKLGFKQEKIDGSLFLVPAWFLINNKDKSIVKSGRGQSFYDHDSFLTIYEWLTFKD